MAPKKSREEILEKKRLTERKRLEKIKNDPILRAQLQEKERQKYLKKKRQGKIKPIGEMSPRQQEITRKKNRENSSRYYYKKKQKKSDPLNNHNNEDNEQRCSPNLSDPLTAESLTPTNSMSHDSPSCSRITRSIRRNILDQIPAQELGSGLDVTSGRDMETPSPPLTETTSNATSPQRQQIGINKVTNRTSIKKKSPWKHLLRKMKYRTDKELQIKEKRIQELKLTIDKYRKQVKRLQNTRTVRKNSEQNMTQNTKTKKKVSHKVVCETSKMQLKTAIEMFFEEDENSRLRPGKKEFITRHKVRKQKRRLNFTLQQLHEKFLKRHPQYKISYSFFCTFRPFWVLPPKIDDRETCLCTFCENMDLVVTALKQNGIIAENTAYDVLKTLCCDPDNVDCLMRNCNTCKRRHITYMEFDNSEESYYWTWAKSKKTYMKDGQSKVTIQTLKQQVSTFPKNIIEHFENLLNPYMSHCANIKSQTRYIKKLKSNLPTGEAIVHCDFSENYNTKYASEIQSVHFGGSRQQVTLHTSVIYYMKNGALCTRSFSTLSECLRHDAIAIWEHLIPILEFIENEVPEVSSLHFISDSPSSQYRNRKMFYVMAKLHWNCPSLRRVVWNYTEKGHGKGPADGVGAVLKTAADRIVARGNDIPNIDTLTRHLKESCKGVTIEEVGESGILEKELLIPAAELKEFRGTMRVHQVIWACNNTDVLAMRSLSCDLGKCPYEAVECPHGQHIGFYYIDNKTAGNNTRSSRVKKTGNAIRGNRTISSCQIKNSSNTRSESTPVVHKFVKTSAQNSLQDLCLQSDDSFWAEVPSIDCNDISDSITNNVLTALHISPDSKNESTTEIRVKGRQCKISKTKNSTLTTCSKNLNDGFTQSQERLLANTQRQVHSPSIVGHDIAIPSTSAKIRVLSNVRISGPNNTASDYTDQSKSKKNVIDDVAIPSTSAKIRVLSNVNIFGPKNIASDSTDKTKSKKNVIASGKPTNKNKTLNSALIKSNKKSHRPPSMLDRSHAKSLGEKTQQEVCVHPDDSLRNKDPSKILSPTSTPNIMTELFGGSDDEDFNIF